MSAAAERLDAGDGHQHRDDDAERRQEAFAAATAGLKLPEDYQLPEGYEVSSTGVRQVTGRGIMPVASAPLLLTRVYVDADGQESVEVAWRGREGWVRRIVARSEVSSGKSLVTALANSGLPVIASDGARAERWLSVVERRNHKVIPVDVLARWLGWQPDGTFLCGPDGGRKVEPPWPAYQADALAAHRVHGTEAGWRTAVEPLSRFPVAVMVVAAAFAAPLLEPLGLTSFMVDICGRSTRGKTTTAKVAASVWGEPTDAGTVFSWQTTIMPAEARLNLVRGLPVVFDETQLVKHPDLVHKILYSLEKGKSQMRGLGPSGLRFHTVLISTGERSVLTFTQEQGAAGRALTLARPPLPSGDGNGALAVAMSEGTRENYGHAGRAFVRRLLGALGEPDGRERMQAAHAAIRDELVAGLPPEADIARRRAPYLASLVLGARLAHEWGVMPVEAPPLPEWAGVFQAAQETDDRSEMALEVLRNYLAGHPGVIHGTPEAARNPPIGAGWLGRMIETENGRAVAILPEPLRAVISAAGYELESVRMMWRDLGVLLTVKDGDRIRDTQQHRMPGGGGSPRFFVFDPKHLSLSNDDE